ncbi:unnamed protein product, partial [Aphanomyces euteiches]
VDEPYSGAVPAPTPVFTDEEVTTIMDSTCDFPDDEYTKEIEDRLYPIPKSDIRKQLDQIRKRYINPSHEELLRTLDLSAADSHLLLAPADIEDESVWTKWFADTLEKCDEARRASRDFKTHPLARISWTQGNPYSVLDMDESHGDDMPTDAVDSDDTFEDDDFSKFELPLYVTGPSG